LLNGQHVDKASFSVEHSINERTFDRDIEDVRLFLSEIYSCNEVIFDKQSNSYYLTGDKPKYIDRMAAAIIAKILLCSDAFRSDEMEGLFHTILSTVTPHDAKAISGYLQYDKRNYYSKTNSAILKTLGDLYAVIHNGTDIEITIRRNGASSENKRVSPLEIEISNSVFYLIGAEELNLSNIVRYRIDIIESFKVLGSTFSSAFKEKYYKEKEKKENGN